jgi:protein involved in polysaccharide export with SLBB domain
LPPQQQPADDRYRIGAGDVLDIRIYNRPQLSREAVRVEGSGMIRMPLIETEIQAACLTEGELAKEISTRYAKYYKNLQVDVFIKEYHSRQVAVIGAVNDQSRFELQRRVRLLELLTYAKGPSPRAGQTINIVHSTHLTVQTRTDETDAVTVLELQTERRSARRSEIKSVSRGRRHRHFAGSRSGLRRRQRLHAAHDSVERADHADARDRDGRRSQAGHAQRQDSRLRQEPGTTIRKEITVDLSAIEKKRSEDLALGCQTTSSTCPRQPARAFCAVWSRASCLASDNCPCASCLKLPALMTFCSLCLCGDLSSNIVTTETQRTHETHYETSMRKNESPLEALEANRAAAIV